MLHPPQPASPRPAALARRPLRHVAVVAIAGTLGACAISDLTNPPNWDLRINIPSKTTSIGVGSMLPAGVTIATDSNSFRVTVAASAVIRDLASSCAACVPLNGLTAPKPAFTFTATNTTVLPADISTATLASGTIALAIVNGFGFDPINVAGAATAGTLVITATDANNRQLAKDSINGATTSLAANSTLNRTLTLAAGSLRGPITISASVNSPAGGSILVNTAQVLRVTGTPQNIAVSSAAVTITNKTISTSATELDLSDLDDAFRDRLLGGQIKLTITNPFSVAGNLAVRFQGTGVDFTKSLALAAGNSAPTITLSQTEIRSLTGKVVSLTITGPVTSATAVTVAPKDKVTVVTRIEVTITTETP